jgi:hypothetical protein
LADWTRFYAPDFHFHLDARSQPVDDRHKAIHREAPEVGAAYAREKSAAAVPRAVVGATDGQALSVERLDDLSGQDRLELFDIRILASQITEHVAAAARHLQTFRFHRNKLFQSPETALDQISSAL